MGSACESRLGVRCVKPQVQSRMALKLQQTFLQRAFEHQSIGCSLKGLKCQESELLYLLTYQMTNIIPQLAVSGVKTQVKKL